MNISTLPQTTSDIGTRLAVKDCELKKKDDALRWYKVATEQLCQFIEVIMSITVKMQFLPNCAVLLSYRNVKKC